MKLSNSLQLSAIVLVAAFASAPAIAQTKKIIKPAAQQAQAPAPPAVMAPAPEPVYAPAPAPAPDPTPSYPQSASNPAGLDGQFLGDCSALSTAGNAVSHRPHFRLSNAGAQFQRTELYFYSGDCSGSIYASVMHPVIVLRAVGTRPVQLPNGRGTVTGIALSQSPQGGKVAGAGAVLLPNKDGDNITVIFSGNPIVAFAGSLNLGQEQWLMSALPEGLLLVSNHTQGTTVDPQGYPMEFGRGVFLSRLRQ